MSEKLRVGPLNQRKALFDLGYDGTAIKGMEPAERTRIINEGIKAPGKKTPVQRRSEKLASIERQSFAKLERVAKRLGVTTDQLINAEYTSSSYNPDKSQPMWSRSRPKFSINPLKIIGGLTQQITDPSTWESTGKKLTGLRIDGIPLDIGLNDARIVSNYRQNLRRLNQFNQTNDITPAEQEKDSMPAWTKQIGSNPYKNKESITIAGDPSKMRKDYKPSDGLKIYAS